MAALFAVAACDVNAFRLGGEAADGDGGVGPGGDSGIDGDGGGGNADASPFDAGPTCTPTQEVCDGQDNDCDNGVDENFDLMSNPNHCGGCNMPCDEPQSIGTCNQGSCEFSCVGGFHDLDPNDPGCEYFCIETNGGVETCDFADNDCNGQVDETFDTDTDLNNCGGCGKICDVLNAVPECVGGVCGFTDCDPGFADLLSQVPGCEYICPVFPILTDGSGNPAENCNGIDDDCDGIVDENPIIDIVVGSNCFLQDGSGNDIDDGVCGANPGQTQCVFGTTVCLNATAPAAEQCDGLDHDCDGNNTNGFDLQTDVNNCGGCGNACTAPNAVSFCDTGSCDFVCKTGFFDLVEDINDPPTLGCEYACNFTGIEVCDGEDNDCDGLTDTADNLPVAQGGILIPPDFCNNFGACNGAGGHQLVCSDAPCEPGVVTFRCQYPNAETTCGGFELAAQETLCDDIDGDCDVALDESFTNKGDACSDGGIGECEGTGTFQCNVQQDDTVCVIDTPGTGDPFGPDFCDNLDNDCDTNLDEDPISDEPGAMVNITGRASVNDFSIYTFEASRPDASLSSEGLAEHTACSNQDVLPWRQVSQTDAAQACADAGLRLCTADEFMLACGGLDNTNCNDDGDCNSNEFCHLGTGRCSNQFPYGGPYEPLACNSYEYDVDLDNTCDFQSNEDDILPTGHTYGCPFGPPAEQQCLSDDGVADMSGNVKEWTSTVSPSNANARTVLGGAYNNTDIGMSCNFDFLQIDRSFALPTIGFRCCGDPF